MAEDQMAEDQMAAAASLGLRAQQRAQDIDAIVLRRVVERAARLHVEGARVDRPLTRVGVGEAPEQVIDEHLVAILHGAHEVLRGGRKGGR